MTILIDEDIVLPAHASYSAIQTYLLCGYQYFLSRIKKEQEDESVWSVGGSSFHKACELYDLGNV